MTYQAPVDDIMHALKTAAGLDGLIQSGVLEGVDEDTIRAIIAEAGKFGAEVLEPLDMVGDRTGSKLVEGKVVTPPGWKEAYAQYVAGGWNGLGAPAQWGGQELPQVVATAAAEIWDSANLAFGLCPLLTHGAIDALEAQGSEELKRTYLPKMVTGEWTGTMNLTEPHAGSDLGALKTRAERRPDGSYRIFGTKIFITYGDHEMTGNIVHLVLARLPDAPPATRGISLFLVPKYLVSPDGSLGMRNDVVCAGVEHKLGIHASPTCVMKYGEKDGAVGYLVGEENRGLNVMFIMMNAARLAVGVQGVALAERATQRAVAYARERKQGRSAVTKGTDMAPIIEHPDIRRNLLTMKALTQAARAICLVTARETDIARRAKDPAGRAAAANRVALLTPVAKAFSTDIGCEVASIGVQVHGGMGFIEETGAAQIYRDARILPIYEGTNGIRPSTSSPASCRWRAARWPPPISASCRRPWRRCAPPTAPSSAAWPSGSERRLRRWPRPRAGWAPRSRPTPKPPWPAPRRISACSALPPAASTWRAARWPRRVTAAKDRPSPSRSRWHASSRRTSRQRRRASRTPWSGAPTRRWC